ncbi:hypothetical protein PV327_007795 [Microctonus hyperodae]|uniref:RGS domain-containing protein n=1 Tax=Microctonus hyperodae TaxID=165561 RepID=A0AA39KYZ5_MICHY|nr:hypothetical protein PV327_007795 [Microctonus hyperodae]
MMLQFFKKSGTRDKLRSFQSSSIQSTSSQRSIKGDGFTVGDFQSTRPLASRSLEEEEEDDDEEIRGSLKIEISSARSRLSKTLPEILADKEALGYFIQFMESCGRLALIKFWMEVECVREASRENFDIINENCSTNELKQLNGEHDRLFNQQNVHTNDLTNNYKEPKTNQLLNWKTICEEPDEISSVIQDALKIHKKYILKDNLKINDITLLQKTDLEEAANNQNHIALIKGLLLIQKMVYKVLETEFIDDFLKSNLHCKHQIDVLTSGEVKLADILYNETAFFYFMEFMELENKRELLDFWMSTINYRQNLLEKKCTDPMEAQSDALIIYDKFFSLQATMPLGFTDKIRFEVEQNICRENGDGPQWDCFDKPTIIVYNFLSKHYLPAFLSSQLYYKYLSELISTIQSGACASHSHQRIKRAGSDCSSEMSICSAVTHDNVQTNNIYDTNRSFSDSTIHGNMNIDARQLYDPDSLWKRTKSSLSVGYVDNMGRFITEIEPDPQRKYESRLSRAVKRLINMEQDKAKEELAWKIAEMIVREITSLTLGTQ